MLAAARPHLLRIVGPNCLGIAMPGLGVNATFAPARLLPGNIAFLTQSGAMATTVLDWALPRGIGFSGIVSMGDMSDVDFGDLLDWYRARRGDPRHSHLRRSGHPRAQVHVGGAPRRAREAGDRGQGRPRRGRRARRHLAHRRARRRRRRLRRRLPPRRHVAGERGGGTVRRRRHPVAHVAGRRRPAGHRHQRRRRRRARHRPADRGGRASRRARTGNHREARQGAAADLEPRQPGRHHRRRRRGALRQRGRYPDGRPGRRCAAGRLLPDRRRFFGGRGAGRYRCPREAGRRRAQECIRLLDGR